MGERGSSSSSCALVSRRVAGHLFVVQGDLTRLACDAWLLPCDRTLRISSSSWLRDNSRLATSGAELRLKVDPPPGWGDEVRAFCPAEGRAEDSPRLWLVDSGGGTASSLDWYLKGVEQFLAGATNDLAETGARLQRSRPLLALPLVGAGEGGQHEVQGNVVRELVRRLHEELAHREVDVALVLADQAAFAAAQSARRDNPRPKELDSLMADADALVEYARSGQLVVFFGAGASAGAGVPGWKRLLERLAERAGLGDQAESLGRLDPLDRARILGSELQLRQGETLGAAVADELRGFHRASLLHFQLASLQVSEFVTTNYDELFEGACTPVGTDEPTRLSVIPYNLRPDAGRWLLKLHGSISDPRTIVITREDYLRYEQKRGALYGIVQALLITKRMLFIGFSLQDDNFYRLVDEVRRALAGAGGEPRPLGTAVTLGSEPLLRRIWEDDLSIVELEGDEATAARRLEVLLDYVIAGSVSPAAHLLDDHFDGVLSEGEREVKHALQNVSVSQAAESTPAWELFRGFRKSLGMR